MWRILRYIRCDRYYSTDTQQFVTRATKLLRNRRNGKCNRERRKVSSIPLYLGGKRQRERWVSCQHSGADRRCLLFHCIWGARDREKDELAVSIQEQTEGVFYSRLKHCIWGARDREKDELAVSIQEQTEDNREETRHQRVITHCNQRL
jgi:hypothetical protein